MQEVWGGGMRWEQVGGTRKEGNHCTRLQKQAVVSPESDYIHSMSNSSMDKNVNGVLSFSHCNSYGVCKA